MTSTTRSGGSRTAGAITDYTGPGIDDPRVDHGRARRRAVVHQLRATRSGGSRPPGSVTNYTGTGIELPDGITAGPDGALWFTNIRRQLDRADHHRRGGHQLHRPGIVARTGSRPDPTARCGSPTTATTRSGGSPPPGSSPTTRAPASATRAGSRPGPTARCGSPTAATTRSGGSPRPGSSPTTPAPASTARTGSRPGPTARCGSPTTATTRSGGSPPPGRSPTTPAPTIIDPRADHGRARRRAVVHRTIRWQRLDRADHHRRDGHELHRHRHRRTRSGSRPAPTAPCGSPTIGNDSIGRITTAGVVTNYTGTGISDPYGITAGPDGALWFTNDGNNSIGRITTAGVVTNYTGTGHRPTRTGSRPAPTAPCGSPTSATTRSGGSPPPGSSPTTPAPGISRPHGITAGPDGALWFTNSRQQLDRADHHRREGHQLHRPEHQ